MEHRAWALVRPRLVCFGGTECLFVAGAAKHLAEQGHTVIVASRRQNLVDSTCATLREETKNNNIHGLAVDLGSLASVKAAAEEVLRHADWAVDTLVCNAGMGAQMSLQRSADDLELCFATNHLGTLTLFVSPFVQCRLQTGHFYLAKLLLPTILANAKAHQLVARVVTVSSGTHDPANHTPVPSPIVNFPNWRMPTRFDGPRAYSQSKLANAMFGNDLAAEYDPSELTVATYDPGFIPTTGLMRGLGSVLTSVISFVSHVYLNAVHRIYGSTLQIGSMARSPAYLARLAVNAELVKETGKYYCIDAIDKCSVDAANRQYQIQLREFSDAILTEKGFH